MRPQRRLYRTLFCPLLRFYAPSPPPQQARMLPVPCDFSWQANVPTAKQCWQPYSIIETSAIVLKYRYTINHRARLPRYKKLEKAG